MKKNIVFLKIRVPEPVLYLPYGCSSPGHLFEAYRCHPRQEEDGGEDEGDHDDEDNEESPVDTGISSSRRRGRIAERRAALLVSVGDGVLEYNKTVKVSNNVFRTRLAVK